MSLNIASSAYTRTMTVTEERLPVRRQLAEQLHWLRRRAHVSQSSVAEAMGVNQRTVSMWECGKSVPHLEMVERLADYFRVKLDDPAVEFRFSGRRTS